MHLKVSRIDQLQVTLEKVNNAFQLHLFNSVQLCLIQPDNRQDLQSDNDCIPKIHRADVIFSWY